MTIENFVLEMLSAPGGDGRTLYVAMGRYWEDGNSEGSCKGIAQETGNGFGSWRSTRCGCRSRIMRMRLLWEALTGEKRGADAAARLLDKRFSSGEEQEEPGRGLSGRARLYAHAKAGSVVQPLRVARA